MALTAAQLKAIKDKHAAIAAQAVEKEIDTHQDTEDTQSQGESSLESAADDIYELNTQLKANASLAPQKPVNKNKTYYAKLHYSRFIFEDGTELYFQPAGNVIGPGSHPNWKQYQKELDAIIGKNPNIYTIDSKLEPTPITARNDPKINAKSTMEIALADRNLAGTTQRVRQQTGPIMVNSDPTSADASSLDMSLINAAKASGSTVMGNDNGNVVQPLNEEQIKQLNDANAQSSSS